MHTLYRILDGFNEYIGRTIAWLALLMVLVQFLVVLMRYIFSAPDFLGISSLWWQELIVYLHGTLIMFGVGYTFLHNGHVRVDIFYADASENMRNWTDLIGSLLFMIPVCYIMWWSASPNVATSWANLEGSTESSGIPYKYLLKSTVMVSAVLLAVQAVSTALKCALRLAGHDVHDPYRGEESLD